MNFAAVVICIGLFGFARSLPSASNQIVKPLTTSETYTHSLVVDDDIPEQYQLFWKLVDKDEFIQFEVHCKTTGWVGFGLSPNGDMPGADITIGWVDTNGNVQLRDTHAVARSAPIVDKSQDVRLIDGKQVDGYTILKFKRPLKSCDLEDDIEIKKETNYMIFAWNDTKPINDNWGYHGKNRRIFVDMLLNFKSKDENIDNEIAESQNAQKIDFTLKNHRLAAKDTYYYCQIVNLPPQQADMHLIRYEVLITPGNKDVFHHLLLYECQYSVDFSDNPGHECGSVRPPESIQRCLGSPVVALWSVGGRLDYYFPPGTGYPIKSNTNNYYLLEYHFDNPRLDPNRVDSSGIRLYLTPNKREHDVGILTFGSGSEFFDLQMPPKINEIMFTSVCYPECFDKFIPDEGITAFSSVLHTHLAGRSVKTKLVRNNQVIMNLFDNPKYDFNYQFNVEIEPIKLYKGDSLIIECKYNTMDRKNMTFWGFSTQEEMCYSFVYFYPSTPKFQICFSSPTQNELLEFYTKSVSDGLIPYEHVATPNDTALDMITRFYLTLKGMNENQFSDELKRRYIEFYGKPKEHQLLCGAAEYVDEAIQNVKKPFPNPTNAIKEEVRECKSPSPSGNSATKIDYMIGLRVISTLVFFLHFKNF